MAFGSILILTFWAFFTLRAGFKPKHMKKIREALYEKKFAAKGEDEARKKRAEWFYKIMKLCGVLLEIVGWIEIVLLILIAVWIFFLIGAVITGTFVIFGYPI